LGPTKKLFYCLVLVSALVLSCASAFAETEPEAMTLAGALARALETHPDLVQARLQLRAAELRAEGDLSLLAPTLNFDISHLHNEEPTQALLEEGIRITDVTRAQTQLFKRTSWGLGMSLQLTTTQFESETPFINPFNDSIAVQRIGPNVQQSLSMTLRQPVLKGFGAKV
jgi:hypothetical protein